MNGIKGFFAKYHAVPASVAGPSWSAASDEALIGWAVADCELFDRGERGHLSRMKDIDQEMVRRCQAAEYGPSCTSLFRASLQLATRIVEADHVR